MIKENILPDWRIRLKYWSVRLKGLTVLLLTFALEIPQHVIAAFGVLPPDFLATIPREYFQYAAIASVVGSTIATFWNQRKLAAEQNAFAAQQAATVARATGDAPSGISDGNGLDAGTGGKVV